MRITTKMRQWDAGEDTTRIHLADADLHHLASKIKATVATQMKGRGVEPIVITVDLKVDAQVLLSEPDKADAEAPGQEPGNPEVKAGDA